MARPRKAGPKPAQSYRYPEADLAARPEIGAQAHFNKPKPPVNRLMLFPRTGAWENLKKALRVEFEETVWDHLAGMTSALFLAGEYS